MSTKLLGCIALLFALISSDAHARLHSYLHWLRPAARVIIQEQRITGYTLRPWPVSEEMVMKRLLSDPAYQQRQLSWLTDTNPAVARRFAEGMRGISGSEKSLIELRKQIDQVAGEAAGSPPWLPQNVSKLDLSQTSLRRCTLLIEGFEIAGGAVVYGARPDLMRLYQQDSPLQCKPSPGVLAPAIPQPVLLRSEEIPGWLTPAKLDSGKITLEVQKPRSYARLYESAIKNRLQRCLTKGNLCISNDGKASFSLDCGAGLKFKVTSKGDMSVSISAGALAIEVGSK